MAVARNLYLAYGFITITNDPFEVGMSHSVYGNRSETYSKDLYENCLYLLTATNMATMKIFGVTSDKFNVVDIYSNVNYADKWIG
jgi:hypothetical protein